MTPHESRSLRAVDLAQQGVAGVVEATAAANKAIGEYAQATTRYVSQQPVKSALIAIAAGTFVAALVLALRRWPD